MTKIINVFQGINPLPLTQWVLLLMGQATFLSSRLPYCDGSSYFQAPLVDINLFRFAYPPPLGKACRLSRKGRGTFRTKMNVRTTDTMLKPSSLLTLWPLSLVFANTVKQSGSYSIWQKLWNMLYWVRITSVRSSMWGDKRKERLSEPTGGKKIKTFQSRANVVARLSIDEPILSKSEEWDFAFC